MASQQDPGLSQIGTVEVGHLAPHVAAVWMRGEHDTSTEPEVTRALEAAAANSSVLVDLSECSFIDSSVIAAFLRVARVVPGGGERCGLLVPPARQNLSRIVEITRLGDSLPIHTNREEAIASFHSLQSRPKVSTSTLTMSG